MPQNNTKPYYPKEQLLMDITCENIRINITTNKVDETKRIIKRLSRVLKPRSKIVKDRIRKLILDEDEIVTRWKEYTRELYEGPIEENNINIENIIESNIEDIGTEEFIKILNKLKQGKASGIYSIPEEL